MALSDTIWWTKKARIQAEKRLLFNDFLAQIILLWYSAFTVCISILELKSPATNSYFAVTMVSLSVLILCASLFVGNRNFKERAMLLKICYEQLSEVECKCLGLNPNLNELSTEYKNILSVSENHKENDFKNALISEYLNSKNPKDDLSRLPTLFNFLEVLFIKSIKFLFVCFIFVLPVLSVIYLRCHS